MLDHFYFLYLFKQFQKASEFDREMNATITDHRPTHGTARIRHRTAHARKNTIKVKQPCKSSCSGSSSWYHRQCVKYHYCMFWSYSLVIVRQTYKPYGTVSVTFSKHSFVRFPFKHGCAAIKCSKKVNIYQIVYYLCSSRVDPDKTAHIFHQSLMHLLMLKNNK